MPSFKADKLRVNLKLCINRLKLLEKKKGELTSFPLSMIRVKIDHTIVQYNIIVYSNYVGRSTSV